MSIALQNTSFLECAWKSWRYYYNTYTSTPKRDVDYNSRLSLWSDFSLGLCPARCHISDIYRIRTYACGSESERQRSEQIRGGIFPRGKRTVNDFYDVWCIRWYSIENLRGYSLAAESGFLGDRRKTALSFMGIIIF